MEALLLVEDNKRLASNLSRYLSHAGMNVIIRSDSESAFKLLMSMPEKFSALLLDIRLPGENGVQLCEKLRQKEVRIPILMLTGINDSNTVVRTLNLGADDYLTKPFAPAEVLARVKALLRRPVLIKSNLLEFDELNIDLDKHEVYFKNSPLILRPREYQLLVYMAKNNRQVLSRQQIIFNVWDAWGKSEKLSETNSVDVHVKDIRKKLRKIDSGSVLIQTIYGYGYKLLA